MTPLKTFLVGLPFAIAAGLILGNATIPNETPVTPTETIIHEDDPRFDCRTMGNRVCGDTIDTSFCGPLGAPCPPLSTQPE